MTLFICKRPGIHAERIRDKTQPVKLHGTLRLLFCLFVLIVCIDTRSLTRLVTSISVVFNCTGSAVNSRKLPGNAINVSTVLTVHFT